MSALILAPAGGSRLGGYAAALLMVAVATLAGLAIAPHWGPGAVDLLYLPAVLGVAVLAGLGPALAAALASALAYNFFFTAPHLTFRIQDPNDLVTVVVLLGVAVLTSKLAASVREQARIAQAHAARSATIAGLARRLLSCTTEPEIAEAGTRELAAIFDCNAILIAGSPEPRVMPAGGPITLAPSDFAAAALVLDGGERTGRGLAKSVPTEWQFHPVRSSDAVIAAVGLARDDGAPPVGRDQFPLLDNLLDQIALALERGRLEAESREFSQARERDQIRAALLASIGRDVSAPLRAIGAAAAGLKRGGAGDRDLVATVASETAKLDRYVANLTELGQEPEGRPFTVDGISVDLFQRAVSRDGERIHLTPKEFSVLAELAKHPGRVLTHAHLLRTVWGPAQETQIDYLRVAIRGLRQKLERDPSRPTLIINEPAVGYRLRAD